MKIKFRSLFIVFLLTGSAFCFAHERFEKVWAQQELEFKKLLNEIKEGYGEKNLEYILQKVELCSEKIRNMRIALSVEAQQQEPRKAEFFSECIGTIKKTVMPLMDLLLSFKVKALSYGQRKKFERAIEKIKDEILLFGSQISTLLAVLPKRRMISEQRREELQREIAEFLGFFVANEMLKQLR